MSYLLFFTMFFTVLLHYSGVCLSPSFSFVLASVEKRTTGDAREQSGNSRATLVLNRSAEVS